VSDVWLEAGETVPADKVPCPVPGQSKISSCITYLRPNILIIEEIDGKLLMKMR
jgi:hypothetical protein